MLGTRVLKVHVPGGHRSVLAQPFEAATLDTLGEVDALDGASPSAAWIAMMCSAARRLVDVGRVVPALVGRPGGIWEARWRPLAGDSATVNATLAPAMPPAVAATQPEAAAEVPAELLAWLVDAEARRRLARRGWVAELGDIRRPVGRAARLLTRALGSGSGTFRAEAQLAGPLRRLEAAFDELARRADGEVVTAVRLRLGLPDVDSNDREAWPLQLELVDRDDRRRHCRAADLIDGSPAALAFAGGDRALARLRGQLDRAATDLATACPWLSEWLAAPDQGVPDRGVDLDTAAATLAAVEALAGQGIEVVAPDAMVRRQPSARGTVESGGIKGRFAADALVRWTAVVDEQPVDDELLRRAAEAGAGLVEVGGRWVLVTAEAARRALDNLDRHRDEHAAVSPIEALQLHAQPDGDDRLVADGWLADLIDGLPDAQLAEGHEPPGFAATLRPYQRRGLGWLQFLDHAGFGGCLADDMGLGKTPTTLAHLAARPGPHLVVCPLSVVHNWEAEAARFVPLSRISVHHGAARRTGSVAELAAAHDIVVSTYATVTRDIEALTQVEWSTVVLDEAQAIKNPSSQTARAMRRLSAGQRLALTGTPVENRLSELWSILSFAVPGLLGSHTQFRARFATPIERHRDASAAASLRALTAPFLLRRTKADKALVPDLPDKVEQVAWATLTHEQATMYQAVVDRLLADSQAATGIRRRGMVLAALTRLKQICNHPAHALGDGSPLAGRSGKLARFDELAAQLLDAGERALIFTQFREMGLLLQRHCAERLGLAVPFLHGGVGAGTRRRMVECFQGGEGPPLLLVSLKAGGTGLNLTAASRVVHYDRWWNPAVEDQASDRAWRIGQQRSVFVHKLVCRGTVEERVDQMITDKRALAEAVIGATPETWLSELTTEELRDLIALDRRATHP
jgi:SNF2-related domain/SNF2 Helicase protein/Helicase conserved C-terminal domain